MRRKKANIVVSEDEIATGTGLSPRVVERALAELVAKDYVRLVEPGRWALRVPEPRARSLLPPTR